MIRSSSVILFTRQQCLFSEVATCLYWNNGTKSLSPVSEWLWNGYRKNTSANPAWRHWFTNGGSFFFWWISDLKYKSPQRTFFFMTIALSCLPRSRPFSQQYSREELATLLFCTIYPLKSQRTSFDFDIFVTFFQHLVTLY